MLVRPDRANLHLVILCTLVEGRPEQWSVTTPMTAKCLPQSIYSLSFSFSHVSALRHRRKRVPWQFSEFSTFWFSVLSFRLYLHDFIYTSNFHWKIYCIFFFFSGAGPNHQSDGARSRISGVGFYGAETGEGTNTVLVLKLLFSYCKCEC